ncbi:MAG TPA: hypothetical protein VEC75_02390 [Stellaceae bacterium]|nr:hypothetical protein [Stellaceae bacterium]HYC13065.1 hypothetical protein [Stellaceae bacterium]
MTARVLLLALASCVLAGCSGPPVVAVKNPTTNEVRNCKNHGTYSYMIQIGSPEECVAALKAQGWEDWRY